jgi:glycosyltransferase involved in cell wall biosynthesis
MSLVSITILTKNRAALLEKALASVSSQTYRDFEIVVIDDASTDGTQGVIQSYKHLNIQAFKHESSQGITAGRQEALEASRGVYIACLDDDDEWVDVDKLKKQVEYFEAYPETVLVGGGIVVEAGSGKREEKTRAASDFVIRNTMLLRNNFFTSTVMFRRDVALKVGGFIKDEDDLAEDYDLWLRMGKIGKMFNFQEAFAQYRLPGYNKEKFKRFLSKQLRLIEKHKRHYPLHGLASLILKVRISLFK